MGYCTVSEVKSAINFPETGSPVSDDDIESFILDSQEEIESIYKTKFGNVEYSSTATSGTTTTIVDTEADYTTDEYTGYVVWVVGGTNEGEYREITINSATSLTVSPAFSSAIDDTSVFRITKLGYQDETIDGNGTDTQFVTRQPLINLNSATINDTDITLGKIYQYQASGKLILSEGAEVTYFDKTYPQLVNLKYVYGVYPMPNPIKRLCIVITAIRTLTAQIAGTYDDFTSVSLPGGVTAAKGEPYMNVQSSLNYLQGEARGIIYGFAGSQVSSDFRSSPSYRPFTVFG